ncbi:MAG: rod shape-determining protein MreD [Chloroflexota bacterium]|nr:rod shape-determining protein MreD [Chloroflexota bacterium]
MSMPVAVVTASLAALLETSVLSELSIAGAKPDLVFVLAIVFAMVVGFDEAIALALVGGLLIDALSGRPLGATALAMLVVTGISALISRLARSPRSVTVGIATFVLSWPFQALLLAILGITAGIGMAPIPVQAFLVIAMMNSLMALAAAHVTQALYRRFGGVEGLEW